MKKQIEIDILDIFKHIDLLQKAIMGSKQHLLLKQLDFLLL